MDIKLVILDNPHEFMGSNGHEKNRALRIFSEAIELRQLCYRGVRSEFLNLDANDLCATHVLLYDVSRVHDPRLLAGLRICFESRTNKHLIHVPFVDRMSEIAPKFQEQWLEYRHKNNEVVNPNMWYVAPDAGFNKTGLPLSEILIWVMSVCIRRHGYDGFCAVINEEFKTSRWFQNFGDWDQSLDYLHPVLLKKHKVMFVNSLYSTMLENGFRKFGDIYSSRDELAITPIAEYVASRRLKVA